MRTLKFIVDGQIIKPDPSCSFEGLVPGSEGYYQAEFILSSEWRDAAIVASFWSILGKEYKPQKVKPNGTCTIPVEALKRRVFKIQLIGQTRNGTKLMTNKVDVCQNGGK